MKTMGYLRVSSDSRDVASQELAIRKYAEHKGIVINKDDWIAITMSSRKSQKERRIDELLRSVKPNDTIIVSELSRLGRSLSDILILVDNLRKEGIKLICIKENININETSNNNETLVQLAIFGMMAELERNLISERTKEGLAAVKASGMMCLLWRFRHEQYKPPHYRGNTK